MSGRGEETERTLKFSPFLFEGGITFGLLSVEGGDSFI